jgi:putative transposase
MKKSRYTEGQIVKALKEEESGRSVNDISRELGINKQTFYNWKKKYAGMSVKHHFQPFLYVLLYIFLSLLLS